MKRTFVTTMPNHIGAFLKASECLAQLGVNITRVSYNKAVDSHTLFIDAEGSCEQLDEADRRLTEIGYLHNERNGKSIVLLEFRLRDVPGSVIDVLRLINDFNFNISYISSQENGTDYQFFKMGLFVEDPPKISRFIGEAEKLCEVRVIEYDHTEKVYDNSIFYTTFVNGLSDRLSLSEEARGELLVNTNLAMQTLDERDLSPYKTFDSISRFAELLVRNSGERFRPRITRYPISEDGEIITIEPPCGSNTFILKSEGELLFIDSGYAVYREEMMAILRELIPDFESVNKRLLLTHADVDHCGLLPVFDEILCTVRSAECLRREYEGQAGFREENPLHKPYIRICKILTEYTPVDPQKVKGLWDRGDSDALLTSVGSFDFGKLTFEVYEGKGGHLPGELLLVEKSHRILFTGDVYINLHGMTAQQAEYNRYAPILMTSVDTDPALCKEERGAMLSLLGKGVWQIFGSHGGRKELTVE